MNIEHIHASEDSEKMVVALQRDGAVIVEDLLDADLLRPVQRRRRPVDGRHAVAAGLRCYQRLLHVVLRPSDPHVTGVAGKSRVFATEVLTHPLYRAMCDEILLPSCACYQLNIAQVLDRGPGSELQLLHRDEAVWLHLPQPHREVQVASVIALVDFTADNGATRVAPGSHVWTAAAARNRRSSSPPRCRPARRSSISDRRSTAAARTSPPTTTARGMHVSYCLGWLHTEENQYLATPLDVVRTLPRESQALLGYAVHDALRSAAATSAPSSCKIQWSSWRRAPSAAEQRNDLLDNSSSWRRSSATGQMNTRCTRRHGTRRASRQTPPGARRAGASRSISSGRWIVGTEPFSP